MSARLVVIDTDRCAGHGRCFAVESELFDCDDAGYPVVRHEPVPPELQASARNAATNCPEGAISVVEAGS